MGIIKDYTKQKARLNTIETRRMFLWSYLYFLLVIGRFKAPTNQFLFILRFNIISSLLMKVKDKTDFYETKNILKYLTLQNI